MALAIPTGTANAFFNKRTGYGASLSLKFYIHTTKFIPIQSSKGVLTKCHSIRDLHP